ncbi:MAG: 4Fe-4S binding protein [Hadesarchaea archaeon]|jgi:ferredoxin|nr:4Fe-4S binding protein [Hadesarchaea archaeon]TDA30940.1 MAG: (Fe-S)-binding protein [Hadesarchaea archaeon]
MEDPFRPLMEGLGFPESPYLRQILEYLMTPEQARVAAALPGSVQEVAQKLGMPEGRVRELLEDLWRKGLVFPKDFDRREYFRFARDLVQLHDATLATQHLDPERDRRYFQLWHEFGRKEFYRGMGEILGSLFTEPIWRVIPAYGAIKGMEGVLPCENIVEIVNAQEKLGVVPCSCRLVQEGVGEPCRYTKEREVWHCTQFHRGAEYVVKRGSGRPLSREEALRVLEKAERDGLVHMGPNHSKLTINTICNCCPDCCEFFNFYRYGGVSPEKLTAKSRFEAYVDQEKCTGCQTCLERCPFEAIELVRPEGSRKYKARVVPERCFGCGVCVVGCEQGAMKFKLVRPPEHIPQG